MQNIIVRQVDIPVEWGGMLAMKAEYDTAVVTISKWLSAAAVAAVLNELLTPDVFGVYVTTFLAAV